VYGGAEMRDQRMELEKGCDILVATPGRLTDMCTRSMVSLEYIQFFILDEADRMLDMGFEPQVRQIVFTEFEGRLMGKKAKVQRHSMMFSATFAKEVQRMASDFLTDYVFITVGRVGSASELVQQDVIYASDQRQKNQHLSRVLNAGSEKLPPGGLAIVFVETKKSADELEMELYQNGVKVTAIHGDRSQTQREEALSAFKTGANPVLVATDVAARGLDIPNVALVVNYDLPKQLDDYVHRIGRTGRAGRKGLAIAFVNERCTYLSDLRTLLTDAKQDPPQWFNDLCDSSRPSGGKGNRRGNENRFGGVDDRFSEGKIPAKAAATPQRAAPPRGEGDWGNSGADDAW
jgi:ATP-dependent RNA helicase DDX3X